MALRRRASRHEIKSIRPLSTLTILIACLSTHISAADWSQFRGPGGNAVSDAKNTPLNWSDTTGIVWKTDLPGPGTSSPIVFGNRIFLTCYTGVAPGRGASLDDLKRHLLCLDRATGKLLWNTPVPADLPEQSGIREDHGYATSTPVADAERVYVFWGKSGVLAFDHAGKQLWKASVGTQLNGWGSATSPVLHKDLVLVNASVESGSLVALDKKTGAEKWRARGINESWHAPLVVTAPGGKSEVIAACIKHVFGFDADTGAPLRTCQTGIGWYMCPTPIARDGIVYAIGGRNPQNGLAIRAGGRGEVSGSHVLWKINKSSNVPPPVLHDGHLYFATDSLGQGLPIGVGVAPIARAISRLRATSGTRSFNPATSASEVTGRLLFVRWRVP